MKDIENDARGSRDGAMQVRCLAARPGQGRPAGSPAARKAVACAVAMALLLSAPMVAAASSGEGDIVRTYSYSSSEGKPAYPESIEQDGVTYKISDVSVRTVSSAEGRVPCGKTETKECQPADLESTRGSFPQTMLFDEDGVRGEIPLVGIEEQAVYGSVTYELNRQATYSGLPTNDVSQIPAAASFSGDTGNSVELALAGISWTVEGYDQNGIPSSFTASCIYRGTDAYSVIDHYEVTATYEGEAEAGEASEAYELAVSYSPVQQRALDVPWWLLPLVAGGAAAAAGGRFFAIWWRRHRRAIVYRVYGDREEECGTAPIDDKGDWLEVHVGERIALGDAGADARHELSLPARWQDADRVVVCQSDRTLYDGAAAARIRLD